MCHFLKFRGVTAFRGVFNPQSSRHRSTHNLSLGEGGELVVICNLYLIKKNFVMKIVSKSPSRQLVRLKGNLERTERISTYS